MTSLLLAVVSASLLGSIHCAGMCGPFALFAATDDGRVKTSRLASYHLGRLFTYLVIGVAVGITGTVVDASGNAIGLSSTAARIAGALLIVLAISRIWPKRTSANASPGWIARTVAKTRPAIARLPSLLRPAAVGSVTVLLPCGWLYAFAIVAAGAGGIAGATLVMSAFWVGTLPWLSGLTLLAKPLAVRPNITRYATAAMLIAAGLYTMTGRAAADFRPLLAAGNAAACETAMHPPSDATTQTLNNVTAVTPPCCQRGDQP